MQIPIGAQRTIRTVTRTVLLATLVFVPFGYSRAFHAQEDVTPPVLRGFQFTPKSFDVGKESKTMDVTFQATDDLSGVGHLQAVFVSPSRQQSVVADVGTSPDAPVPPHDAYQTKVTIPRYAEFGTWSIQYVLLSDRVGNQKRYEPEELKKVVFETEFTIDKSK